MSTISEIIIDTKPQAPISKELYMQFMEPLGLTDGSVEAAWNFERGEWREDFVSTLKELSPGCIRWGGIFSGYYRWKEGVGPRDSRVPMRNYMWDGWEQNQIGTDELATLCRMVGAEPLLAVNFLGDGRPEYGPKGAARAAGPDEAAEWVSYCNDPDDPLRRRHGRNDPYGVKLWQVGNETSYRSTGFSCDETISHTREFSARMKERDPSIEIIGWGDRDVRDEEFWAPRVIEEVGSEIDMIAMHLMQMKPQQANTVLNGREYMKDRDAAWQELSAIYETAKSKVDRMLGYIRDSGSNLSLAITEGHLSLKPHNTSPLLSEWLSALFHARIMNLYERNADRIRIATLADFCGTRWLVNALMIPVPWTKDHSCYLMPAGRVMSLFGANRGDTLVDVSGAPDELDISASQSGGTTYLHVCNTSLSDRYDVTLSVNGRELQSGTVHEIAPGDLGLAIDQDHPRVFDPSISKIDPTPSTSGRRSTSHQWSFPPASVSVVVLESASK